MPEEIVIKQVSSAQSIEVGTPVAVEVEWKPNDTSVKEIDGRGLLLVGMAVIALSMIAWNVTWLNPGVIK